MPPFGSVLGIKTYCDDSLKNEDEIVFNAGLRDKSVFIKLSDYIKLENPEFVEGCSHAEEEDVVPKPEAT